MENVEVLAEGIRKLQQNATYADGNAIVPGYMLEQLFLDAGLEVEMHYLESAPLLPCENCGHDEVVHDGKCFHGSAEGNTCPCLEYAPDSGS